MFSFFLFAGPQGATLEGIANKKIETPKGVRFSIATNPYSGSPQGNLTPTIKSQEFRFLAFFI